MKYTVLTHWKLAEFEKLVEAYLKEGWVLQGGVALTTSLGNEQTFAQEMIKQGE